MSTGPVTEVLARATSVEDVRPSDARAGADYQRVTAGGQAYFLKRLSPVTDWIMRLTGDHVHRPYLIWQAGIMNKAPACIDHTVVAMEVTGSGDAAVLSMLMRDVGPCLVPPGDTPVPQEASGVRTAPWWERQLDLCMIGIMATFGWEKALGDAAELGWWQARVAGAIARCGLRTSR